MSNFVKILKLIYHKYASRAELVIHTKKVESKSSIVSNGANAQWCSMVARVVICNSWAWQGVLPFTPAPEVRLNPIRDTKFPLKEGVYKKNNQTNKQSDEKQGLKFSRMCNENKRIVFCRDALTPVCLLIAKYTTILSMQGVIVVYAQYKYSL